MARTRTPDTAALDSALGERVHQLMFRRRMTQLQLAPRVGLDQSVVSRKIRGEVTWTVLDLLRFAAALEVDPMDLVPPGEAIAGQVAI